MCISIPVSGVTLLEGARGQGMVRCVLKSKRATRASLAAWGPGAGWRAPVGSSGDPGAKPLKSSCVFSTQKTTFFNANLYRHKIVNIGLGRFSNMGGGSNNCEQSEQTERLRKTFTGVQGLVPWRGLQSAPLRKNILYFAS